MTATSYYFYCFLIIDQKKSDIMCIHTYILYILYNIYYIYIYKDVSFIYQPPRSFLSTHSSKASLNFSSVISTPFFQSSQLVLPRWSCIDFSTEDLTIQMPHAFGTKIWYSLQKKRCWSGIPFFCDLSSCMGSDTLTSPAGNLCAYIFSTKCPRRPLRSTRSRTKDLLPFRRSPSP